MSEAQRKLPIPAESIGEPRALDSLAALILRRLAARERPNLTIVDPCPSPEISPEVDTAG